MRTSLLVLTDFSPAAARALRYADTLAGAIGAELVLLHVRRDSLLDPARFTGQVPHRSDAATAAAFTRAIAGLTAPVVTEAGHGQVATAVADALVGHPSALLVLGRPDEESIPEELISTTAVDLLRAGPKPMLVVPYNAPTNSLPPRVLLAIDAAPFTLDESQETIRCLFDALHAQLTVMHVSPDADKAAASVAAAAFAAVTRLGLLADFQDAQTRTVSSASPADRILQYAASGEFDLIVLIARPRSFLGDLFHQSVTAAVLRQSPLPVLVLPAL